jgi:glycosyltransferase involved in cell wall biosynthesis
MTVIDKSGNVDQTVYIPVKREADKRKRIDETLKHTEFLYSKAFTDIDRLFYRKKVNKLLLDVQSCVDVTAFDMIHAHFLFSLGGVAFRIKQTAGIPYVVSIRNVDVNLFFRYGIWLRDAAAKIIKDAQRVIFISPAYKERVLEQYIPRELRHDVEDKSIVLPNGINDFWIQNVHSAARAVQRKNIRLIYVGELTKNKNIGTSIKVAEKLIDRGYRVTLKIAGRGPDEKNIARLAAKSNGRILFYGYVEDRRELLKLYGESDIFIMPSRTETFGVSYVEAMSQGLPIIFSRNEGFDGFYEEGAVGYAVNPLDIGEIVQRIEDIYAKYGDVSKRCVSEASNFSWDRIGSAYIQHLLGPWHTA